MSAERENRVPVPVERGPIHEVPATGYYYPYPTYPTYPSYPTTDAGGFGAEGEAVDWKRLLLLLWERKWWILAATVLATTAAFFLTRALVEPKYEARSTIWLDESARKGGAITAEDVLEGAGWADLMRSFAVLEPVVMEERLFVDPKEPDQLDRAWFSTLTVEDEVVAGEYTLHLDGSGNYRLAHEGTGLMETGRLGSVIGRSSGFAWRPDRNRFDGLEEVTFDVMSPRLAAFHLRTNLAAGYNKEASLITTTLIWSDPEEAADILNGIVDHFVRTATELKNRKQAEIVNILERQTEFAAGQLRERELALESYRIETATEPTDLRAVPIPGALQTRGSVFDVYFEQRLELRRLETDVEQLQRVLSRSREGAGLNELALQQVPSVGTDSALLGALSELYEREANRRALLYTYTERHPTVVEESEAITRLRDVTIPSMIESLIRELRDREALLQEGMTAQAGELRQIPSRAIEDTRREREFELAEDLHNKLLTSLREATLAAATSLPDLQVVDAAFPPFSPISNDGPRIIFLVAVASFGMSVGGVLLHDRLDRRIRSPEQITRKLGLPVLGIVPRLDAGGAHQPVQAAVAVESFRAIRTQLSYAGNEAPRIVLVTSPAPRDGKSMVSANLAISYAASGRATILVDADTRRGKAEQMFSLSRSPGLSDVLLERCDLADAEQVTGIEQLTLLARGDTSGFNAELLSSERMEQLLRELGERYDMVVLDAPPLAAGADTLLLGKYADKVVVVFRAGQTDEELARAKLGMVGNVEIPFAGAILNAVPETAHYYDYYASHYYADTQST